MLLLILWGGVGGLGKNAGANFLDVTYPENNETISSPTIINFDFNTDTASTSATASIWLSHTKGARETAIYENQNIANACTLGSENYWADTQGVQLKFINTSGTWVFRSFSRMFYFDGKYHLLIGGGGTSNPKPTSYTLTGSTWSYDGDYNAGLPTGIFGGAEIFEYNGSLYFFSGTATATVPNFWKYNSSTHQWNAYAAIGSGLSTVPVDYYGGYHAFEHNNNLRLIEDVMHMGGAFEHSFKTYTWNTSTSAWDNDNLYLNDYNNQQDQAIKNNFGGDIFTKDGTLYALMLWSVGGTQYPGKVSGAKWNGSAWAPDYDINAGLTSSTDQNYYALSYSELNEGTISETTWNGGSGLGYWINFYQSGALSFDTTITHSCSLNFDPELYAAGTYYIDMNLSTEDENLSNSGLLPFTISGAYDPTQPPTMPATTTNKTGIYIVARTIDRWLSQNYAPAGFAHPWTSFAAGSTGTYPGKITIDGAIKETCNHTWNCFLDLNIGQHTYALYAINGGWQYTGTFNLDINTNFVEIYAPMTYNVFTIWPDSTKGAKTSCSSLYSLTAGHDVSTNKRIGAGLKIGADYVYWNATNIIPENCYSTENVPANYPFALPGWAGSSTEPAAFAYSGISGIGSEGYALHQLLDGISGGTNKEGKTNFYNLYTTGDIGNFSNWWTGDVARKTASQADGEYSPLVSINVGMNTESYRYGDANYNPGDFGIGDNIACEADLRTYGHMIYDVNIILVTDQNKIYAGYSFTPYKNYNLNSDFVPHENGIYNTVWHIFENVDTGHTAKIYCGVQTTNELAFKSGWIYSNPRVVWSSNYSTAGGINIFVKDEAGTTSYYGHKSQSTGDLNNVDVYNWYHAPWFWTYDTSENPLTLYEGDGVMAFSEDTNTGKIANKTFDIDRGDSFDISLYLPNRDSDNHTPVITRASMQELSAFGNIACKAYFYDRDLDFNQATFKFWTSEDGSYDNPNCTFFASHPYTTNCNPKDAPCPASVYQNNFLSECGYANDCYVKATFSKRACTGVSPSDLTGMCSVQVTDFNGNKAISQATASITVEKYQIAAMCESYALVNNEKQDIVFTTTDKGYVECTVFLDNMANPDQNFSLSFEGKQLGFLKTEWDAYMGRSTHYYRAETTAEMDALAQSLSTDGKTWEGDATVFLTHPVYGIKDITVQMAITFLGKREASTSTGYSEANANELYDWADELFTGLLTNPIKTVQTHFFDVLVIVAMIIIFGPLLLYGLFLMIKLKSQQNGD